MLSLMTGVLGVPPRQMTAGDSKQSTHQFSDLTLQVQDAVKFPLATALCCNAVLTPPPHVMDKLKLFRGQFVHFHQHLEVIPWKICDLIYGERQLHLE